LRKVATLLRLTDSEVVGVRTALLMNLAGFLEKTSDHKTCGNTADERLMA
jgi:hypothetical protein